MAKEEEKKEGEAEAEAPKPKSKKKLIIIIAVVVLLAGGGGAFALMGGSKAEEGFEEEKAHDEEHKHLASVTMDTVIVNLSENASFLKTKMTLEYDPEILASAAAGAAEGGHGEGKSSSLPPGLAEKEAMIRDSIIRVLSAKTAGEVLSVEGKEQAKEELIEAINEAVGLDEGPIASIYFNEFIIQ